MYAWYEKTTHMCCAFFYDITQIFYIVLAGQEKQIIEADESVTQSIRKIQLFIRRHEDYWKDHVKQKIYKLQKIRIFRGQTMCQIKSISYY